MAEPTAFADLLRDIQKEWSESVARNTVETTQQTDLKNRALEALSKLGSATVQDDEVKFTGSQIILPEQFSGKLNEAAAFLTNLDKQESMTYGFSRVFKCRPWDGAAAFQRALIRVFGTSGLGKVTPGGFFSPDQPPQLVSISVGIDETLQVPWGEIVMPPLNAAFTLGQTRDPEAGQLFYLSVQAPRKRRQELEGFFDVVQDELNQRSIYRGNAFDGADMPNFIDVSKVNPAEVVYSEEVVAQLEANLWSIIRYTPEMVRQGLPLKRAVLLTGPWGTGKSLAGVLTAQIAAQHGWTFIQARPGKDDLLTVLATAKLYQPCIVQFEDIDTAMSDNPDESSALLDALDGIGNKGVAVVTLLTTNHIEKIRRAVMRPGRIDSIIEVGPLDPAGVERLVKVTLPALADDADIDWPAVHVAFAGFLPAFITEACNRAARYAMVRGAGRVDTITTEDLAHAAAGIRPQLEAMMGAEVGPKILPTLDEAFTEMIRDSTARVIDGTKTYDYDGDYSGKLEAAVK